MADRGSAWRGGARGRGGAPAARGGTSDRARGSGGRGARGAGRGAFSGGGERANGGPADEAIEGDEQPSAEDAESRKHRFESSKKDNRFLELKPLREKERELMIKQGYLPNPDVQTRLAEAINFVGTCEELCPEFERHEREYQNNVDPLERYPGTNRIDPDRAVKAFHRPAGQDQPLPSDVRPPHILEQTLDYLFHDVLQEHPLHVTHSFLRDRTRSVRQDFTMQNIRGESAIECNERIARYHVLILGTIREQISFSESQELEQLRKVLKSLNEFYDDARTAYPPILTPNEAEFRAYNILTHLRDPDIIWSTELLPPDVFNAPVFQTALTLHALAQRSNLQRGERASLNALSRFFKFLADPSVPYLFGCILSTHFGEIRKNALDALRKSYVPQHSSFPARTLAKVLGCDDEEEVIAICDALGVETSVDHGKLVVKLHKGVMIKMDGTIKAKVSNRLVEAKRGETPYSDIIDGVYYATESVNAIPQTPSIASPAFFPRVSSAQATPTPPPTMPSSFPTTFTSQPAFPSATPRNVFGLGATVPASTSISASAFGNAVASTSSPFGQPPTLSQPVPRFPSSTSFPIPSTATFGLPPPLAAPQLPKPTLNPFAASFHPPPPAAPVASFLAPAQLPTHLPPPINTAVANAAPAALLAASPRPAHNLPPPRRNSSLLSPGIQGRARIALIQSLTSTITTELVRNFVSTRALRAVEQALKERWEVILSTRRETRAALVTAATNELVRDVVDNSVRRTAREVAWAARADSVLRSNAWDCWVDSTGETIARREVEQERQRQFRAVARDIGVGPAPILVEDCDDGDEDGLADLGLASLSIGGFDASSLNSGGASADDLLAERLRLAQQAREDLWTPGTFLESVVGQVDSAFRKRAVPTRHGWTAIVSTDSPKDAFSSWLACKFDLSGEYLVASMDTTYADIEVQMISGSQSPSTSVLESVGMVILDCTKGKSFHGDIPEFWMKSRERLHAFAIGVHQQSVYDAVLLVLVCPDRLLDADAEAALRARVLEELHVSKLMGFKDSSVLIARLDDAGAQLAGHLAVLLDDVVMRPEKMILPLTSIASPLLALWTASLERTLARASSAPDDTPLKVMRTFIGSLAMIVADAGACAVVPSSALKLPSLPETVSHVRPAIRAYIQDATFADAGHFATVEGALAERPFLADLVLVRCVLEHLADYVRTAFSRGSARQETLSARAGPLLSRLESTLESSDEAIFFGHENGAKKRGLGGSAPTAGQKKRKASLSPTAGATGSLPKKPFNAREDGWADGRPAHKLDKLGLLMRDAQALLSRN